MLTDVISGGHKNADHIIIVSDLCSFSRTLRKAGELPFSSFQNKYISLNHDLNQEQEDDSPRCRDVDEK